MVLKFEHRSESSGAVVKIQIARPHLQNLIQWVWDETRELVFLLSPQLMAMLLAQGSYFENLVGNDSTKKSCCHCENPVNTVVSYCVNPITKIVIEGERLKFFQVYMR